MYLKLLFAMGNLYTKLEGYFELSIIMPTVGNLYAMLGGYFELFS